MTTLKKGVCYAGLVDVFGGTMWYVHTPDGERYHSTKNEARKTVREAWSHDKEMKQAIMAQLNRRQGRAYCYLN